MRLLIALIVAASATCLIASREVVEAEPPQKSPAQLLSERGLRLGRSRVTPMALYDNKAGHALRFVYEVSSPKPLRKDQAWKLVYELRLAAEQFKHDTPVLIELFLCIDANSSTDPSHRAGFPTYKNLYEVPFSRTGRSEGWMFDWKDDHSQLPVRTGKNVKWYAWATSFRPWNTDMKRHSASVTKTGKWTDRLWWADACCEPGTAGRAAGGLPVEVK